MTGAGTTQAQEQVGGDPDHAGRPAQAGRALVWSLANTAAGRLGTLAIGIVLARLLGPAEFGTYAVAFVALMAMLSFNELGVSLAIVRWQRRPGRDRTHGQHALRRDQRGGDGGGGAGRAVVRHRDG